MHFNTKLIGWVVVVLIVGGALYSMISNKGTTDTTATQASAATPTVGSDLLDMLGKLQTVNFNTDIFSNSNFNSLVDYAITLPTPNLGRPNPFDKIGVDIGPVTNIPIKTGTTTSVQ